MVEVWVELEPTARWERLERELERIKVYRVDALDVPDAPLGIPKASAPLIACYVWAIHKIKVVPHIRLLDINTNALLNIVGGLLLCGIENIVMLQGDPPKYGRSVSELDTDKALQVIRDEFGNKVNVGCLLSLRKDIKDIRRRVEKNYDFFLLLRAVGKNLEKLEVIRSIRNDARLIAYMIVCEDNNCKRFREMFKDQPIISMEYVSEYLKSLTEYIDGVLISSPGSLNTKIRVLELLKKE